MLVGTSLAATAQKVMVEKQIKNVATGEGTGFGTTLEGPREQVAQAWTKFLKDVGRAKSSGEWTTLTEVAIGGAQYAKGTLFTQTKGDEKAGQVWIGLIPADWQGQVNDLDIVYRELDQLVYRFGVSFYRDKIQLQINEAQQAVDAVERQAQRLINESKSLANKLTNNEQEKIRLENALKENALEHAVLLQKIENNKKAQDSVAQATVKIKKVVDLHRERQRQVN
jgi:hypothetical protein